MQQYSAAVYSFVCVLLLYSLQGAAGGSSGFRYLTPHVSPLPHGECITPSRRRAAGYCPWTPFTSLPSSACLMYCLHTSLCYLVDMATCACPSPSAPQKCARFTCEASCDDPYVVTTHAVYLRAPLPTTYAVRHPALTLPTLWTPDGGNIDLATLVKRTWHVYHSVAFPSVAVAVFLDSPLVLPEVSHFHVRQIDDITLEVSVVVGGTAAFAVILPCNLREPGASHWHPLDDDISCRVAVNRGLTILKTAEQGPSTSFRVVHASLVSPPSHDVIATTAVEAANAVIRWTFLAGHPNASVWFPTTLVLAGSDVHGPCALETAAVRLTLPTTDVGQYYCSSGATVMYLRVAARAVDCSRLVTFEHGPEALVVVGDLAATSGPEPWLVVRSEVPECLLVPFEVVLLRGGVLPEGSLTLSATTCLPTEPLTSVCWTLRMVFKEAPHVIGTHDIELRSVDNVVARTVHVVPDRGVVVLGLNTTTVHGTVSITASSGSPLPSSLEWTSNNAALADVLRLQHGHRAAVVFPCLTELGRHTTVSVSTASMALLGHPQLSLLSPGPPRLKFDAVVGAVYVIWDAVPTWALRCRWLRPSVKALSQECYMLVDGAASVSVEVSTTLTTTTLQMTTPPMDAVATDDCPPAPCKGGAGMGRRTEWFVSMATSPRHICCALRYVQGRSPTRAHDALVAQLLTALSRLQQLRSFFVFSVLSDLVGYVTSSKEITSSVVERYCDVFHDEILHPDSSNLWTSPRLAAFFARIVQHQTCSPSWLVDFFSLLPSPGIHTPLLHAECRAGGPAHVGRCRVVRDDVSIDQTLCCMTILADEGDDHSHVAIRDVAFVPRRSSNTVRVILLGPEECLCLCPRTLTWRRVGTADCAVSVSCLAVALVVVYRGAFPWAAVSLVLLFVGFVGMVMGAVVSLLRPRRLQDTQRRAMTVNYDLPWGYGHSDLALGESVLDAASAGARVLTPMKMA